MKSKSILLFVVAIGCGTVAMLGVQKTLSRDRGANQEEMVKVLVATTEIEAGVPLDPGNTRFKPLPKSSVPEDAVTKPEDYENRALKVRAYPGDLILLAKLSEGFGATVDIPQGMRVVTISVDATKTHSGLMLPGNRVDILVTYRAQKEGSNDSLQKTRTILENIRVFATDNRRDAGQTETGANQAKNISLLVTPEQGNLLMLAENKGKLHLALRRDNDTTEGNAYAVDEDMFEDGEVSKGDKDAEAMDVFEEPKAAAPAPTVADQAPAAEPEAVKAPETPKWKMSIFSGAELKVEEVEIPLETNSDQFSEESRAAPASSGAGKVIKGLVIKFFAGA